MSLSATGESSASNFDKRSPVFLTGGTGFVGVHTANALVERGYRVRCLVRQGSDVGRLPPGVELVRGDLEDETALRNGVKDVSGVIHISGIVRAWSEEEFLRVNRDGVARLAAIAGEAGVKRFVLCSSQAAGGPSTPERRRTIDEPPAPVTRYGRSKLAGEEALKANAGEMSWAIVRPPAVYGPHDYAFLTLVRWARWGFKLKVGPGEMPFAMIHGEDLGRAMVQALEAVDHPRATWYATDGVDHSLIDLSEAIESALGRKAAWLTVPLWAAPIVTGAIENLARLRKEPALLSRQKLIELTQPAWTCDDSPFREQTGFRNRYNLREGMAQTLDWYRQKGWI